jgi:hypothetical protein
MRNAKIKFPIASAFEPGFDPLLPGRTSTCHPNSSLFSGQEGWFLGALRHRRGFCF